jgi:DNA-directed RNA polymerase beta subunit
MEEINPMHIREQMRRITLMGDGGLTSDDSISTDAQNVHPSEFGFIDSISGPESSRIGVDTRAAYGSKIGSDGNVYQRFFDRKKNKHVWLSARDLEGKIVGLPD